MVKTGQDPSALSHIASRGVKRPSVYSWFLNIDPDLFSDPFLPLQSDWLSRKSQVISCRNLWNVILQRHIWRSRVNLDVSMYICESVCVCVCVCSVWWSTKGELTLSLFSQQSGVLSPKPGLWLRLTTIHYLQLHNAVSAVTNRKSPSFFLFALEGPQRMSCKI